MELAEFVYLLAGFFIGLLLAGVLYVQEKDDDRKRREVAALKSLGGERFDALQPHPNSPHYSVDDNGNFRVDPNHPHSAQRLAQHLDELRAARPSYDDLARTFKDDGTLNWVVHNEFHYSLWLLGERLQYWPTKSKWRWRTVTHTGDVEAFIRVELEEAAEQNPRSTDHE